MSLYNILIYTEANLRNIERDEENDITFAYAEVPEMIDNCYMLSVDFYQWELLLAEISRPKHNTVVIGLWDKYRTKAKDTVGPGQEFSTAKYIAHLRDVPLTRDAAGVPLTWGAPDPDIKVGNFKGWEDRDVV